MKILSFGEIIWDTYPDRRYIGGAPLNFAAHAQRCGAESYLLSAIGNDEEGEAAKRELTRFRINDRFVATVDGKRTGKCIVTLDGNAVPHYEILTDVAYDHIPFSDELKNFSFDALVYGTLAIRSDVTFRTLESLLSLKNRRLAYCDLNLRAPFYKKETVEFCLKNADIVKLSEEELAFANDSFSLSGRKQEEVVESLAKRFENLSVVVVTLGENGSFAYEKKSGSFTYCKAEKVKAVSTVGAGDSFGAAFLTAYLRGEEIKSCLKKGAERSAFVVSKAGAIPDEE